MTSPKLTADELEATVRSLIGRRIETVVYYDVSSYGTSQVVWDFDEWHDVVSRRCRPLFLKAGTVGWGVHVPGMTYIRQNERIV
jgi:hypothetical protein